MKSKKGETDAGLLYAVPIRRKRSNRRILEVLGGVGRRGDKRQGESAPCTRKIDRPHNGRRASSQEGELKEV